jgi:hypothetical protein
MSETTGNAGRVQMSPVNSAPATKLGAVTRSKNVLPGALRSILCATPRNFEPQADRRLVAAHPMETVTRKHAVGTR